MNDWEVFGVTLYGKRPRLSVALSIAVMHALLHGTPADGPPYYLAWLPVFVILNLWLESIGWLSRKEIPSDALTRPEGNAILLLNTIAATAILSTGVARYVSTDSVEQTVLASSFMFGPLIAAVAYANLRHHQERNKRH